MGVHDGPEYAWPGDAAAKAFQRPHDAAAEGVEQVVQFFLSAYFSLP